MIRIALRRDKFDEISGELLSKLHSLNVNEFNCKASHLNKLYVTFVSTGFDLHSETYFGLINELNLI